MSTADHPTPAPSEAGETTGRCTCGHLKARHGAVCYECPCRAFVAAHNTLYDAMQWEQGEHHWRDGLLFKRMPSGEVRLRHWRQATTGGRWTCEEVALVPAAEWESIVREVAPTGTPAGETTPPLCHICGKTGKEMWKMERGWECAAGCAALPVDGGGVPHIDIDALADPDFCDGLDPVSYLERLHGGTLDDPLTAEERARVLARQEGHFGYAGMRRFNETVVALEAQLAEECARAKALEEHLMATGDDALKDLLRQYLNENDLLAETADRLAARYVDAEQERDRLRAAGVEYFAASDALSTEAMRGLSPRAQLERIARAEAAMLALRATLAPTGETP